MEYGFGILLLTLAAFGTLIFAHRKVRIGYLHGRPSRITLFWYWALMVLPVFALGLKIVLG